MNRLKSHVAVAALLRRAQGQGAFATVLRKGDPDAGALHVAVRTLDGFAQLYSPIRNMAGEAAYLAGTVAEEREVDAKVARLAEFDPDIWVVEVEDRRGRHFLVEPIEE